MNLTYKKRKKMSRNRNIVLSWLLLVSSLGTFAQSKLKDTVEVDVVKAFQPTIVDAVKINDNPIIIDTTKKIPVLNYSIQSKKINTVFDIDPINPAKMVGEPLAKLYHGLVKAGFGNYTTPYGELFYNNLRSKEYSTGIHLKHLSSAATLKDYGFSGYSDNDVSVYGKKFINKQTLSGDLDYTRNVVHAYGYVGYDIGPVYLPPITKQRFSFINPKAELVSYFKDSSRVNHDIRLSYYNLNDINKATENNVLADAIFKTYIGGDEPLTVKTAVDYYNNKTPKDISHNVIIKLSPFTSFQGHKYNANVGMTVVGDVGITNTFHFYPNADINYQVIDNIFIPYAGVSGGWNKNSFKALSNANPFVSSDIILKNSNNKYNLYAGLRGTLESATSFNLKGTYSSINDMLFFVNNTSGLGNKFNVIYDDATQLNLHGEISYQKNEKLRLLAKGDYYNYTLKNELAAWYKPQMEFAFSGNYNLRDKIVVKVDIFVLSKQYAKVFVPADSANGVYVSTIAKKELKSIADINLGTEYRYNKKLSAFVNLNNVGAFRYYRWYNYPAQRFNFIAGFTYSF